MIFFGRDTPEAVLSCYPPSDQNWVRFYLLMNFYPLDDRLPFHCKRKCFTYLVTTRFHEDFIILMS